MFPFFRKNLLIDTDAAELMRVKQILDAHQIRYNVKTTLAENVLARNFNAKAAERYAFRYSAASAQSYVYYLSVNRRDYKRAKDLIRH